MLPKADPPRLRSTTASTRQPAQPDKKTSQGQLQTGSQATRPARPKDKPEAAPGTSQGELGAAADSEPAQPGKGMRREPISWERQQSASQPAQPGKRTSWEQHRKVGQPSQAAGPPRNDSGEPASQARRKDKPGTVPAQPGKRLSRQRQQTAGHFIPRLLCSLRSHIVGTAGASLAKRRGRALV